MEPVSRLSKTPCPIDNSDAVKKLAGKSLLLIYMNNDRIQGKLSILTDCERGEKCVVLVWNTWTEPERRDVKLGSPARAQAKFWKRYLDEQAISIISPNDDDQSTDLLLSVVDEEMEMQVLDDDRNVLCDGVAYLDVENSGGKFYPKLDAPQDIATERVKFFRLLKFNGQPSGRCLEISQFTLSEVGPSPHYTFRTVTP
jgi:hypothetical protein